AGEDVGVRRVYREVPRAWVGPDKGAGVLELVKAVLACVVDVDVPVAVHLDLLDLAKRAVRGADDLVVVDVAGPGREVDRTIGRVIRFDVVIRRGERDVDPTPRGELRVVHRRVDVGGAGEARDRAVDPGPGVREDVLARARFFVEVDLAGI